MSNDTRSRPMTAETIHTCSYYCERPECVRRQRDELRDRMKSVLEAARGAVDGCHCAACTCNPGMTPAIRFDTSPAAQEGAVRDHLIALGWTPPGAQQPEAVDEAMVVRAMTAEPDLLPLPEWVKHDDLDGLKAAESKVASGKCDGSCRPHSGTPRLVEVEGWGFFSYCDEAIAEDGRRGIALAVIDGGDLAAKQGGSDNDR